jgi:glycosyltransferase involved in cell wall biosynthesis
MRPSLSVVVISYRNPSYLDLCLKSLFENRRDTMSTEIICVLDGFAEESSHVVEKYPDLNLLALDENKGQIYAHNHGVIAAKNEYVLLLNDDNVAGRDFDVKLLDVVSPKKVIAPNQVEPRPSIFPDFVIENLGTTPDNFQYETWLDYEQQKYCDHRWGSAGGTWPLLMSTEKYLMLGGIDPYFPSPAVADWDLFLRCELAGLTCARYFASHFFHFAGVATRKADAEWNNKEVQSMEYFNYKWGFWPARDKNNSLYNQYLNHNSVMV